MSSFKTVYFLYPKLWQAWKQFSFLEVHYHMLTYEVVTEVSLKIQIFWDVTPHYWVRSCWHYEGS